MAWIKWSKVLKDYDWGGLNVGSLKASNWALIAKWWWRFRREENSLWVRVIKSLYGVNGGFKHNRLENKGFKSVWGDILRVGRDLEKNDIFYSSSFKKKNGSEILLLFGSRNEWGIFTYVTNIQGYFVFNKISWRRFLISANGKMVFGCGDGVGIENREVEI